jgi:hypothetical protein
MSRDRFANGAPRNVWLRRLNDNRVSNTAVLGGLAPDIAWRVAGKLRQLIMEISVRVDALTVSSDA